MLSSVVGAGSDGLWEFEETKAKRRSSQPEKSIDEGGGFGAECCRKALVSPVPWSAREEKDLRFRVPTLTGDAILPAKDKALCTFLLFISSEFLEIPSVYPKREPKSESSAMAGTPLRSLR